MIRWAGKLAVVTGASSGIGEAIVRDFAKQGINVVGLARREHRVKALADQLKNEKGKIYPVKTDLEKDEDIVAAFKWIKSNLGVPVHILVNNAGLSIITETRGANIDEWRKMFNVNVLAMGACIREQLKTMKANQINEGQIINICSIVGHYMIDFPGFDVYTASKHASRVISEGVRKELLADKSDVKVTSISPGYVATEFFDSASPLVKSGLSDHHPIHSGAISDAVCYILSLPDNVLVRELFIQAPKEIY